VWRCGFPRRRETRAAGVSNRTGSLAWFGARMSALARLGRPPLKRKLILASMIFPSTSRRPKSPISEKTSLPWRRSLLPWRSEPKNLGENCFRQSRGVELIYPEGGSTLLAKGVKVPQRIAAEPRAIAEQDVAGELTILVNESFGARRNFQPPCRRFVSEDVAKDGTIFERATAVSSTTSSAC